MSGTHIDEARQTILLGVAAEANILAKLLAKSSSSPLTSGNLAALTGSVQILSIIGRVTTAIQAQGTTVNLSLVSDSLASFDICTTLDINGFAVGSLLTIDGTPADAMIGTTGVAVAIAQAKPIDFTCITGGHLTVTYGAASTGAIAWEIRWLPLNAAGSMS